MHQILARKIRPSLNPREKNMSTAGKVAIGAGVLFVGVPLVLFTIGMIGVAAVAKKGLSDVGAGQVMSGSTDTGYTWKIQYTPNQSPDTTEANKGLPFYWAVQRVGYLSPVVNGRALTYQQARAQIDQALLSLPPSPQP